ncbi:MAG: hypothetical protein CM1200mP16_05610 [Nitrospina sp.]|nr:MAG: hypothetical protein CM1200mP16_05610 [Nitrospina sp.]
MAYQKGETFKPVLAKLEEKHPKNIANVGRSYIIHISERKIYRELDKMTLADVIDPLL